MRESVVTRLPSPTRAGDSRLVGREHQLDLFQRIIDLPLPTVGLPRPNKKTDVHSVAAPSLSTKTRPGRFPGRGHNRKCMPAYREGRHTPIVDKRFWAQVQNVLERHSQPRQRTERRFTCRHGLLACAKCGCSVIAKIHTRQYICDRCAQISYRQHAAEAKWVREPVVED